jgi:hypothetical protein
MFLHCVGRSGWKPRRSNRLLSACTNNPRLSLFAHRLDGGADSLAALRLANGLERMPPFWTAFSLALTETVGGSVLALPIALAGVGPIPGVVLLVILGLVNILTIAGIVEAITRNGNIRYGTA